MNKLLITLLLFSLIAQEQVQASTPAASVVLQKRKTAQARLFRKTHVCPATNKIQSICPGYVVDHIVPLCAGGADKPINMQYQSLLESYKKDIQERALCSKLRAAKGVQ